MSNDSLFLKKTTDLLETDPEIKSFVYQQIQDFSLFVTPETLVMVIARNPNGNYKKLDQLKNIDTDLDEDPNIDEELSEDLRSKKFRIAIILKDGEHSIESESFNDNIYEAIRTAKEMLVGQLVQIQNEIESPQDRIKAIQQASDIKILH